MTDDIMDLRTLVEKTRTANFSSLLGKRLLAETAPARSVSARHN